MDLYKVLSSYGLVEELPGRILNSEFDETIDELLKIGNEIVKKHQDE